MSEVIGNLLHSTSFAAQCWIKNYWILDRPCVHRHCIQTWYTKLCQYYSIKHTSSPTQARQKLRKTISTLRQKEDANSICVSFCKE